VYPRKVDISDDEIIAVAIVRDALPIAYHEARLSNSPIGPKHLLLGLAKAVAGALPEPITSFPMSAEARTVWDMAVDLGREHDDGKITVSDLLTALATAQWPSRFGS